MLHDLKASISKCTLLFIALLFMALLPVIASADYILTAPPRETPEAGEKLYGPLADHLSKLLNEKVQYKHPGNWLQYETGMKQNNYDIVFDGPHFAAWRLENNQAKPLVRLPGKLDFVLTVRNDLNIKEKRYLVGKKICTLPPPNLGAMTVYAMFPNQVRQPDFVWVTGGFKNVASKLETGDCDAAIFRKSFFEKKMTPEQRVKLAVLETSKPYINQGVTISSRIPTNHSQRIFETLTKGEGLLAAKPIFDRFSVKNPTFVPAKLSEYKELNLMRENNMFGW